jgi:hypothetical protein
MLNVEEDYATFKINDGDFSGIGGHYGELKYYDLNDDEIYETSLIGLSYHPRQNMVKVCLKSIDLPKYYDCDFCSWSSSWVDTCDDLDDMLNIIECNYLQSFGEDSGDWGDIVWEACSAYNKAMGGFPPTNLYFSPLNKYNSCYFGENCIEDTKLECGLCGWAIRYIQDCLDNGGQNNPSCFWDDMWENYFDVDCNSDRDCESVYSTTCGTDNKCIAPDVDADIESYLEHTGWCADSLELKEDLNYCSEIIDSCYSPFMDGSYDDQVCYNSIYDVKLVEPCTCDGYYHTGHWLFPNEQNCYGTWWNPGEPEDPCMSWGDELNGLMYTDEFICNDICAADGYNEEWTGTCGQCNGRSLGGFVDISELNSGGMAECLCSCAC